VRRRRRKGLDATPPEPKAAHRRITELRRELNTLVAVWARTTGQPHAVVHADLRRVSGGGEVSKASPEQIQTRIDTLRARLVRRG
jgi:hypothetical protein